MSADHSPVPWMVGCLVLFVVTNWIIGRIRRRRS